VSASTISYETRSGPDELTYVYAPAGDARVPLVALVHGSHMHPRHYSTYAAALADEGFVVVAPEHVREFFGSTAHYPQQAFVNWVLDWALAEDANPGSPLHGRIDTDHLFVTGHSMGGGTTLGIVSDFDQHGLVVDEWSRPPQLVAAVANATHNIPPPRTGDPLPVDNKVPLAFVHGSSDGIVTLDQSERSFKAVHGVLPRLFVELEGASHFFVTDDDAPEGASQLDVPATLDHATGVESAARWTATWFRANLGDVDAVARLRAGAGQDEPHLRVEFLEP
jgi:predicted dienelactone hydrolase